jgi:peptide/nickel transport system ATP-binding protein
MKSQDSATALRPLVSVKNITKSFDVSAPWLNRVIERKPKLLLKAVSDVSFDIQAGETLALVGESGCGKSTIAKLLVGLYKSSTGSIEFDSRPLAELETDPKLRQRVQMIFQDPYASLNPRWRVLDIIAEPLRVHKLCEGKEVRSRVEALLKQVGLTGVDADKYPHQFSGGQRQRLSIARALASEPEFLVCDEPTSALDVSVQAQVLNLMRDLQKQKRLTYLFISHNLAVVHHVSDRVGVMYLGKLVELGDKQTVFSNPQHPYTRMLLDAIPDIGMTGEARTPVSGEVPNPLTPPSGCTFHPRCAFANNRCSLEIPQMKTITLLNKEAQSHSVTNVACHAVEENRTQFSNRVMSL